MTRVCGELPGGRAICEFTLTGPAGMRARILNYGGIITELSVPDRHGDPVDVLLGFDRPESYAGPHPYFGAIIGRFAGRIARGRCRIGGAEIALATNAGENHLHGGTSGFDRALWSADISGLPSRLVLNHVSPDGDEGYPGTLLVRAEYTLSDDALHIVYTANADQPTIINLTQHCYFNLSGPGEADDVLGHELQIRSDAILELDEELIPTGVLRLVAGTPFDFRQARQIGRDIDARDSQLVIAGGYDHTWVLKAAGEEPAVVLVEPVSGRRLEVYTTQPGVQVYTANILDGSIEGKGGIPYQRRAGVSLETQCFPDSPNHPGFPSTLLRPGENFRSRTVYRFPRPLKPG